MKLKKFNSFINESAQDDDMMSDEEIYEEVIERITKMKNNTNQWSTRDTLKHFTSYGFWNEGEMASIDIEVANQIADELLEYVKQWRPGHPNIEEVYDDLYNY